MGALPPHHRHGLQVGPTNPAPLPSPALFHKAPGGHSYIILQTDATHKKSKAFYLCRASASHYRSLICPCFSQQLFSILRICCKSSPTQHGRQSPGLDPMATEASSLDLPHVTGPISPACTLSLQRQCGLPCSPLTATQPLAHRCRCLLCHWHLTPSVSPSCSYIFKCFLFPGYVPRAY